MKKSNFIRSSIILIFGGIITKFLGMLVRIVLTREIGTTGMGLYALILPTFLLLLSISGMGLSTALNVLISSEKHNNKKLIITSLFFSLLLDAFIFLLLLLSSKFIATNLLNEPRLHYPLLCIGFILPFISVSNIIRSYFFSKERMIPHVVSNILEDLIKLFVIYFIISTFRGTLEQTIALVILSNILCEISSIIIFMFCLPKFSIKKEDIKLDITNIKNILKISIPTTASKLIGSFTYFLEPIILTKILLSLNYSNHYIINEYGIINGYVLPVVLLPSFFTNAISQALIPIVSRNYHKGNHVYIKTKILQAIAISLFIGMIFSVGCFVYGENILSFLYNTDEGIAYIKFLLPIFILYYIEGPLLSSLQALNKAKLNLKISIVNFFIRTVILAALTFLSIGMYGLLIAVGINILFTVIYSSYHVFKTLH